ncbi:hypothetical protein AB1N83_010280 [Pleurotus pulmonarius]
MWIDDAPLKGSVQSFLGIKSHPSQTESVTPIFSFCCRDTDWTRSKFGLTIGRVDSRTMWLCPIPVPETPLGLACASPGARQPISTFLDSLERRGQTPLRDCHQLLGTNSTSPGPRS